MPPTLVHDVIPVGMLQCNCSILGDPESGEAIVVDPGDEVERIQEVIEQRRWKVRAIISTHTHIDHVGGLAALHRVSGAPVLVHQADMDLYRALELQAQWLGVATPETTKIQDFVKEGDALRWGGFAARVLHTPGHTPGSVSLVVELAQEPQEASSKGAESNEGAASGSQLVVLAGDTLFRAGIGRTDLWGGSFPQIISSIRDKLLTLPEDLIVYPGHGETTTIGFERENNALLR